MKTYLLLFFVTRKVFQRFAIFGTEIDIVTQRSNPCAVLCQLCGIITAMVSSRKCYDVLKDVSPEMLPAVLAYETVQR